MPTPSTTASGTQVVSALEVRANFGKLLDRVDSESRSLVIEKRGAPRAVLIGIREYVKLAAPEPEILRLIGQQSQSNGTSSIRSHQMERLIKATRAQKKKR